MEITGLLLKGFLLPTRNGSQRRLSQCTVRDRILVHVKVTKGLVSAIQAHLCDKYLREIIRTLKQSAAKHRSDIRPGKRRFGLYRYLRDVYELYLELRSKRKARTATRRIAKICKLSIQRKSHPIRILIEASAGPEDNRAKEFDGPKRCYSCWVGVSPQKN